MMASALELLAKNGSSLANCCLFSLLRRDREGDWVSSRASAIFVVVMIDQLARDNTVRSGEVADVGQHRTNTMLIPC